MSSWYIIITLRENISLERKAYISTITVNLRNKKIKLYDEKEGTSNAI